MINVNRKKKSTAVLSAWTVWVFHGEISSSEGGGGDKLPHI